MIRRRQLLETAREVPTVFFVWILMKDNSPDIIFLLFNSSPENYTGKEEKKKDVI